LELPAEAPIGGATTVALCAKGLIGRSVDSSIGWLLVVGWSVDWSVGQLLIIIRLTGTQMFSMSYVYVSLTLLKNICF
jgi:hypothetical protein